MSNGTRVIYAKQNFSKYSALLKTMFSLILLAIIIYQIDLSKTVNLILNAEILWLMISLFLVIGAVIVSAYKWQFVFKAQEIKTSFWKLTNLYFVGLFFNNFLPTSIGGDIVRAVDSARYTKKTTESVASIIVERLLASSALGLLALLALVLDFQHVKEFYMLIILFSLGCLLFLLIGFNKKILNKISKSFTSNDLLKNKLKITEVGESINKALLKKREIIKVVGLSIIFQFIIVLINFTIAKALNLSISFAFLLVFVPVINALTLIPISFNGLGVREWSYVYLFSQIGIKEASSLSISLYFYVIITVASLIGGIIFTFRWNSKKYG